MDISIAEAHNRLSHWLKQVHRGPVRITRRGKAVGVFLRAFFPDEAQVNAQALVRDHVAGQVQLKAPTLLPYELGNAVLKAERRGRIGSDQSVQIIDTLRGLNIEIFPLAWGEMLPQARRVPRSA